MIKEIKSFKDVLLQLKTIESWLNGHEINTKNKRFEKMIQSAEILATEQESITTGKKYDFKKLGVPMTNLASEIDPLLEIYKSFKSEKNVVFINSLRHIINGPEYSKDENSDSNVHRNRLFELRLAAKLASEGIVIKSFEDIVFDLDGFEIAMQCKRPMQASSLARNIADAYQQLQKNNNLNVTNNVRGLIAISVDKILGLDKSIENYENLQKLKDDVINKSLWIDSEYSSKWKHLSHKRVLGIILFFGFPIYVESENFLLTSVNFCTILSLIDYKTRNREKKVMGELEKLFR